MTDAGTIWPAARSFPVRISGRSTWQWRKLEMRRLNPTLRHYRIPRSCDCLFAKLGSITGKAGGQDRAGAQKCE